MTFDKVFTINLTDVNEFAVTAPTDANASTNAVNETAANGTVVGITAAASDADATNNAITYALFDNAGGRFAINSSTGVVTVADGTLLDRETAASHNITVRAISVDGSTADTVFTINLNDVDEFDVGPVSDTNAGVNSVAENAAIGTQVGVQASAADADATTNIITYTLDNNAGGRFAVDASTGVVTVLDGS
ncbi:MAG: cadherin repeat domain-containing protein, partial [Pirellulaceae bacterium]|nr:cadherin repeat domain-containing protein [Pirellulaceae bacterium]